MFWTILYDTFTSEVLTNDIYFCCKRSILGRIIRITDEVIEYRKWIKDTFQQPINEGDSLSSSTGSDASTLSAPASDTVNILKVGIQYFFNYIFLFYQITLTIEMSDYNL